MPDVTTTPSAAAELARVRELYASDPGQQTLNALIYGKVGTGKTFLSRTCPQPVLIHSFDPGGTKSVRDMVGPGFIIDARFEKEDAYAPSAYREWEKEFERLRRANVFASLGTYIIDSVTTFHMAIMNAIMHDAKRTMAVPTVAGKKMLVPEQRDYQYLALTLRDIIKACTALPCNFIMTGHIETERDEVTGAMENALAIYPSLRKLLPTLFDEIYVAQCELSSGGLKRQLLLENTGNYVARSRLAAKSKLSKIEDMDIRAILTKAGLPSADKEPLG